MLSELAVIAVRRVSKMAIKRGLLIVVLTVFCWLGFATVSAVQANTLRLESRVDRLESGLSQVRSQLTRLKAQVSRSGSPLPPIETTSPLPNELSLEEQFDNLATLAIELKLDVRDLQERVSGLEQAE